jgi:L-threonylcarbamoyladenylate synthase
MPLVSQTELITAAIAGQVVSFPTDTVPALATRPESASLIFATKKRAAEKPLILMGACADDLWDYIKLNPENLPIWQQLAQKYWPGALTIVLPASDRLPVAMNPTDPTTIGLRVPDCPIALAILQQTGPLATTSANLSGAAPLQSMTDIAAAFPQVMTLEAGEEKQGSGLPSTVVKWTGKNWQILRQGTLSVGGAGE